jgi:hypothetical protein
MLQAGGELAHQIHTRCNKAWHEGTIPEEWGKTILARIQKKRHLSKLTVSRLLRNRNI